MVNPEDIHVVLLTYDKQWNFYLNLDIIRKNYDFGKDIWISHVYNGDMKQLYTGVGENNFLRVEKNRGYQEGALDLYKKGLDFAKTINKKYTMIMNSDVWVLNQQSFLNLFNNIGDKYFSTGKDIMFGRPLTDMFIFKTEHIPDLIEEEVLDFRKEKDILKEEYRKTGWKIFEEWMLNALYTSYSAKKEDDGLDTYWEVMFRGEHPRYSWNEKNHVLHIHDINTKKKLLLQNNILKGDNIENFIK